MDILDDDYLSTWRYLNNTRNDMEDSIERMEELNASLVSLRADSKEIAELALEEIYALHDKLAERSGELINQLRLPRKRIAFTFTPQAIQDLRPKWTEREVKDAFEFIAEACASPQGPCSRAMLLEELKNYEAAGLGFDDISPR